MEVVIATIGSISVGIRMPTQNFKRDASKAQGIAGGLGSALGKLKGPLLAIGGIFAAGAIANGLKNITLEAMDNLDALGKFADATGTTVSEMNALKLGAQLSGTSMEVMKKGIQKMVTTMGEAKLGFGEGVTVFQDLGLSAEEMIKQPTIDSLKQVADAVKNQVGPAERSATAYRLMGKSGLKMLTFLEQGSEGIENLMGESEKLGGAFTRVNISSVEQANDAIAKMEFLFENVKNQLAINLAPIITAVVTKFTDMTAEGVNFGSIIEGVIDFTVAGFGVVADVIHTVGLGFDFLKAGITKGIAFIVQGHALWAKAIQELLNLLPGVETTFGDTFQAIGDDLHKLAGEQWDTAMDNLIKEPPSTAIKGFFQDIKDNAKLASDAMQNSMSNGLDAVAEASIQASIKAGEMVDIIKEKIANFGKSQDQISIDNLTKQGASSVILDQAKALQSQLKGMENAKNMQDDLAKSGKSVFESTRTDLEKYNAELLNLQELLEAGAISQDTFARASAKAKEGLGDDKNKFTGFAGLAKAGSAEAQKTILANRFGGRNSGINKIEANTKNQLAENKTTNGLLETLVSQTSGGGGLAEFAF